MQMTCRLILVNYLAMVGGFIASFGDRTFAQIVPDTTLVHPGRSNWPPQAGTG
jgi:hypothetical protein